MRQTTHRVDGRLGLLPNLIKLRLCLGRITVNEVRRDLGFLQDTGRRGNAATAAYVGPQPHWLAELLAAPRWKAVGLGREAPRGHLDKLARGLFSDRPLFAR